MSERQHVRILAFAGSTREASYNRRLLRVAVAGAREAGAYVTELDLKDYPLPLYDGDLEAGSGIPENGMHLKALFLEHDALLIAAPEYNSGMSGVLKNTIDWVSRRAEGEAPLACFRDKTAALLSASPGRFGGVRGLIQLRQVLSAVGVHIIGSQLSIPNAGKAFDGDALKDADQERLAREVAAKLTDVTARLIGSRS